MVIFSWFSSGKTIKYTVQTTYVIGPAWGQFKMADFCYIVTLTTNAKNALIILDSGHLCGGGEQHWQIRCYCHCRSCQLIRHSRSEIERISNLRVLGILKVTIASMKATTVYPMFVLFCWILLGWSRKWLFLLTRNSQLAVSTKIRIIKRNMSLIT